MVNYCWNPKGPFGGAGLWYMLINFSIWSILKVNKWHEFLMTLNAATESDHISPHDMLH
jgi:hypothetical protein